MSNDSNIKDAISFGPEIRILSRPSFSKEVVFNFLENADISGWEYESAATPAELLTEVAGRFCYMSFGERQHTKDTNSYIANLIRSKHDSVLEHASWTFLLSGVSRSFTHQLVRHRVGFSYSQLSQQYHDERDVKFVVPHEISGDPEEIEKWVRPLIKIRNEYSRILLDLSDAGKSYYPMSMEQREILRAKRSAARSVLPNCTETTIVFSANAFISADLQSKPYETISNFTSASQ